MLEMPDPWVPGVSTMRMANGEESLLSDLRPHCEGEVGDLWLVDGRFHGIFQPCSSNKWGNAMVNIWYLIGDISDILGNYGKEWLNF